MPVWGPRKLLSRLNIGKVDPQNNDKYVKVYILPTNTWRPRRNGRHFANGIFNCMSPGRRKSINTLRPRQDGRYFADDILKCIFFNDNVWISLKIPLKFVSRGPINNIPASVQIMAWRRPGDKPLSEPKLVFVPTHICVTRPQTQCWLIVNWILRNFMKPS